MTNKCKNCDKEVPQYVYYCDWTCCVERAKKDGGAVHTPNGLPIACIKADGTMWEHEHGDHPDYKFPVSVEYTGPLDPDELEELEKAFGRPFTEKEARDSHGEDHALIYADGHVALTMYECCYALWFLDDGSVRGGSMWRRGEWMITGESLDKIRKHKHSELAG